MRTAAIAAVLILVPSLGAPAGLDAQRGSGGDYRFRAPVATLTVHGGLAMPRARSELFSFTTQELTLARSDFVAGSFGADLALMLGDRMDLVLGVVRDQSLNDSEFRDWVDNNDLPIEQTTRFLRQPFTAGIRYHFAERGRSVGSYAWIPTRFVPFVGIGAGLMRYEFEQAGDFIDMATLDVFSDRFLEEGWSPVLQGSAGASWNLNPYLQVVGEFRYLRARGDAGGSGDDFQGFGRLDLSGLSTMFGLSLRF